MGERLRLARKKAKLSQEKVAEKLNIARSNISKYEHNKLEPNIHTIKQFCKLYGITADYLLGIEETAKEQETNNISIGNIDQSNSKNSVINIGNKK